MKTLNEAFVISKRTDQKGNYIAYIDPNKPENKETFKYKDIFKNHGARWNNDYKFWFWYIGKTKDQWQNVYSHFIEPALKEVHGLESAPEEESAAALTASLDALLSEITATPATTNPESDTELTTDEKKALIDKLGKFKETLVNIDSDEEFKKTMQTILSFKNAQGHSYSFMNTILIMIQNPKATLVKSEINWSRFNRTIIDKKNRMIIRSPSKRAMRPYSKVEKEEITAKFLKSVGKNSYNELGPGERERLGIQLRGAFSGHDFDYTFVYDVSNTQQMEGKENFLGDYEKRKEIKWFEENMISEEIRPIYKSLLDFAQENGIRIELVDELNGARGMSSSGMIQLLKNEGNDVGLTKTLAHEIAHELLHQNYVKSKNSKYAQYFVGKSEGRDAVEQQAELTAWMVLGAFNFDLKTTSLNYAAIWGADKDAMIRVFDTVSSVVSMLVEYISRKIKNNSNAATTQNNTTTAAPQAAPQNEALDNTARTTTPMDVARFLGVEREYQDVLNKNKGELIENFYSLLKKL